MYERDTTIQEIHETRRRIAEKFNGDVAAILEDARQRQIASGRRVWQGSSSKTPAAGSGGPCDSNADEQVEDR